MKNQGIYNSLETQLNKLARHNQQAIREHAITIKGKGGKIRTVPINQQIISALDKSLKTTPTGSELLVPDGVPTDKAINQLQQFILRNREAVQDPDSNRPLSFHGLRHTYAAENTSTGLAGGLIKPYSNR